MQNPQSRVLDYKLNPSLKKKEEIIKDYEPLIHGIIKKKNLYGEVQDLMQEGRIALMRALDTYSPEKSQFATYAFTVIRNGLFTYIKKNNTTVNSKGRGDIQMVGSDILDITATYDKNNDVTEEVLALIKKMKPRQQYWVNRAINGEKPKNHSESELISRSVIKLRKMVKTLKLSGEDLSKSYYF